MTYAAVTRAAVRRTTAAVAAVAALAGCSSGAISGDEPAQHTDLPPFDAKIVAAGEVEVLTDAVAPDDLRALFDDVRNARSEGDSWRVTIRCASVPARGSDDPVLATGRFANTQLGLAETGLTSTDEVEFQTTGRADCTPLASSTPGTVTADQVIAAVEAAGLPAPNPRDSSNFCAELHCLQRTTTDAFTVVVWPSSDAAARWSRAFPLDAVRVGPVTTVEFTQGELLLPYRDRQPDRAAYEQALAPLG